MTLVKEKIMHVVELMDDDDALHALKLIQDNFLVVRRVKAWDEIEEVKPDEFDIEMIKEIESNPDCNNFISQEELFARRKLN